MKTTIEFVSDLTEAEARQLLFDVYERVPIAGEDLSYAALPDKITRYVNETHRLLALEEAVARYILEECNDSEQFSIHDPINLLLSSHKQLSRNIHEIYKEEY